MKDPDDTFYAFHNSFSFPQQQSAHKETTGYIWQFPLGGSLAFLGSQQVRGSVIPRLCELAKKDENVLKMKYEGLYKLCTTVYKSFDQVVKTSGNRQLIYQLLVDFYLVDFLDDQNVFILVALFLTFCEAH